MDDILGSNKHLVIWIRHRMVNQHPDGIMVKAKRKGNTFENQVYRDLRAAGLPGIKFSIGSGSGIEDEADLISNNYVMECKHYKEVTDWMVDQWWKRVMEQAKIHKKDPVLIYKENYQKAKVVTLGRTQLYGPMRVTVLYLDFLKTIKETEGEFDGRNIEG